MQWFILFVAGLLEIVWAVGLKYTQGFTRLWPSVVTIAAMAASLALLGLAMRHLPPGTAYAVWVGIGASITVAFAMLTGGEPFTWAKLALLAGLIGCIVGLWKIQGRNCAGRNHRS